MVLDQGQYCCPRDLWKCLQTLLVITTGRRVLLVFNGQKPGTLLIIPQYKGQPHNKEMPIKPRLRNWFRSFFSTWKLGKVFFGEKKFHCKLLFNTGLLWTEKQTPRNMCLEQIFCADGNVSDENKPSKHNCLCVTVLMSQLQPAGPMNE